MVAEVFAGISALRSAIDIVKNIKDTDDAVRLNAAKSEFQKHITELEQAHLALLQTHSAQLKRYGELEEKYNELLRWKADDENYRLIEIGPGCVAYIRIPRDGETVAPSWLCANCYENRKKSHLQFQTPFNRQWVYHCPTCNSKLSVPNGRKPGAE